MIADPNNILLSRYLQAYFGFEVWAAVSRHDALTNPSMHNADVAMTQRKQIGRQCLIRLARNRVRYSRYQVNKIEFPNGNSSLSYSGNTVAAAFSSCGQIRGIGVDIEQNREMPDGADRLILSARERARMSCTAKQFGCALLRVWTVKEAILKADPLNRKTGWLTAYELLRPHKRMGEAVMKRRNYSKTFQYISFAFGAGYVSFAVCL